MLRTLAIFCIAIVSAVLAAAQTPVKGSDTIVVIPFENKSKGRDFNWIGESFAESLPRLLGSRGLRVFSNQERRAAQRSLGMPTDVIPSTASAIRIGQKLGASLVIVGTYDLPPTTTDAAQLTVVNARIIKVSGGIVSEDFPDARKLGFTVSDALGSLQKIHGQLAWEVLNRIDTSLYKLDKDQFPWSQNSLITEAQEDVPARAFEAYIKGRLAVDSSPEVRENYFKNAMRLFAEAKQGVYMEAAIELAHLTLSQGKTQEALAIFQEIAGSFIKCKDRFHQTPQFEQCRDDLSAEAVFYSASILQEQGSFEKALATLRPLADDLKLVNVHNTLGVLALEAARAEKKDSSKSAALLNEAIGFLKAAVEAAPDNMDAKFNYAAALVLFGDLGAAATQLREVIAANPRDGEAYFLLAKALAGQNDPNATTVDNEARRYLADKNRYAILESEWSKTKKISEVRLRSAKPQRSDFANLVLTQRKALPAQPKVDETSALLADAKALYDQGKDDDAITLLRRILTREPMSADGHLLVGKIHLRRGEAEQAVNSLKTALFWNNKLVDAHVSLGKIYLDRGDCLQVRSYLASAQEVSPDNADVQALKRQAERCSK